MPTKSVNKEISSRSMTVARYHEVTLGLTHSQLILPIPLHITPAFDIDDGKYISIKFIFWRSINCSKYSGSGISVKTQGYIFFYIIRIVYGAAASEIDFSVLVP